MKRTLVLVVDRDDDFGVKGKVSTPVIGVQGCTEAATALGIADPEDSDLNALYAAISTCLELQEDGQDAECALICGNEKVGYKSDLALATQLEEVLSSVEPDSIVLVGDGAEDEYIYPIISSRAHVDSVRKVYVKQAPGVEGTFYILTRMLADPAKRKRFLLPLGALMTVIALIFLIPGLYIAWSEGGEPRAYASLTGAFTVFAIGVVIILYSYDTRTRMTNFSVSVKDIMVTQSIKFIFTIIAITLFFVCMLVMFFDVDSMYSLSLFHQVLYVLSGMVWPTTIALFVYILGAVIQDYGTKKTISWKAIISFLNLAAISLVASGILDIIMYYMYDVESLLMAIVEIVAGVVSSIVIAFYTNRLRSVNQPEAADEVYRLGTGLQAHLRRFRVRPGRGCHGGPRVESLDGELRSDIG